MHSLGGLKFTQLTPPIATSTINLLHKIFSTHGLPKQLVSDDGPAFTSNEFRVFMEKNDIRHSLTSPYHILMN